MIASFQDGLAAAGAVFIRLLNMSFASSFLIAAVFMLRLLLKKAPKWTRCLLWAIVAVRLLCPFAPSSPLSVFGLAEKLPGAPSGTEYFRPAGGSEKPLVAFDAPRIAPSSVPVSHTPPSGEPAGAAPAAHSFYLPFAAGVWLCGVSCFALYALLSTLYLRRKVSASVRLAGDLFLCDDIDAPFILGIVRPRIYLPSCLSDAQLLNVLAHERAHLKRRDHWWKPLGFLLLAIHWFNPLVWLAFILLCRDIELACDEKVVRELDLPGRADYSQTLLDCSARRTLISACPLAFGETDVKERVRSVLHYRKPALWIIVAAVALCAAAAVFFLTDPPKRQTAPEVAAPAGDDGGDVERQLALMADSADVWRVLDERDGWAYAVTDLDRNGRLEIISSENHGTGHYSTNRIWEVSADFQSLELCIWPRREGDSEADLASADTAPVYYDASAGLYHYVFIDYIRISAGEYAENSRALTLERGVITETPLESRSWPEGPGASGGVDFRALSDYGLAADRLYEGLDKRTACFGWLTALHTAGLTRDELIAKLTESLDAFSIVEAPLSADSAPVRISSGAGSVLPYVMLRYARTWEDGVWTVTEGVPVERAVREGLGRIPVLALEEGLCAEFADGVVRRTGIRILDAELRPLEDREDWYGDTAVNWLEPGTYFCVLGLYGQPGRYIASEQQYEETAYDCLFRLSVPEGGAKPYSPAEAHDLVSARLRLPFGDITLTDGASLARLEEMLSGSVRKRPVSSIPSAGCPFGSVLYFTRADGAVLSLCPAEDSCGVVFAGGAYYRYAGDNREFWALFSEYARYRQDIPAFLELMQRSGFDWSALRQPFDDIQFELIGALEDYVLSHELSDGEFSAVLRCTGGLDGAFAERYQFLLDQLFEAERPRYLRLWTQLDEEDARRRALPYAASEAVGFTGAEQAAAWMAAQAAEAR